ncbi:MAG: hypothetical protein KJ077_05900 [Anaerolineae bacterium]|nr:hypothetical protein [Anaerolineae bacterium]
MNVQELKAELKKLDDQWQQIHAEHKAACDADERDVVAGRLDKDVYLQRDKVRAGQVLAAKAELSALAQQLVKTWVCRFEALPVGAYFNLLNDQFYHDYRKIEDHRYCLNAHNLTTGQICWIAETVSVVKCEGFSIAEEFQAARAEFDRLVKEAL